MTDSDPTEFELAAILDRLTDSTIEHRPSLEDLAAKHPHLAAELRELWGTVMVVDAVAQDPRPEEISRHEGPPVAESAPPPVLGDFELLEEIRSWRYGSRLSRAATELEP